VLSRLSLLVAALVLSSCARLLPSPDIDRVAGWEAHRAKLAALDHWRLQGRIAVRVEQEGWTATLHWIQDGGDYRLRVMAPLSRGSVEISGSESGVMLRTGENEEVYAENPEALLAEALGWQLPLSGLAWWIRGLPGPHSRPERMTLDEFGRLSVLRQDGWNVLLERYTSAGGYDLPGRLTLENHELRLRLAVSSWEVGP
jgi:outer membrane lipoprotein LolB